MQVTIKEIRPGLGARIATIQRSAFPGGEWRYTIFASARIHKYFDSLLVDSNHLFIGAYDASELVAFMHICGGWDAPHLNYLAVDPKVSLSGIGRKLLHHLIELAEEQGASEITLDVSINKAEVSSWYSREGFRIVGKSMSYIAKETGSREISPQGVHLHKTEAEQRRYRRFGLCTGQIRLDATVYDVGVLGERLFRIKGIHSPNLVLALGRIDPAREIMIVLPETNRPLCQAKLIDESLRMSRSI